MDPNFKIMCELYYVKDLMGNNMYASTYFGHPLHT